MDSYIRSLSFAILFLLVTASLTTGLRCYSCADVILETSNSRVNQILNSMAGTNEKCRTEGVNPLSCPAPGNGQIAKCIKVEATIDASVLLVGQFKMTTLVRGCAVDTIGQTDSCRGVNAADKVEIQNMFSGTSISVNNVQGTGCACSLELCNAQTKLIPTKMCLIAGFALLAILSRLW